MSMKKLIVGGVWAVVVAIWIGTAVFYVVADPDVKEWTIVVATGAVALEIAFWTTAAMLGLTLWQSRQAVFRFLTSPFRRNA